MKCPDQPYSSNKRDFKFLLRQSKSSGGRINGNRSRLFLVWATSSMNYFAASYPIVGDSVPFVQDRAGARFFDVVVQTKLGVWVSYWPILWNIDVGRC